MNKTQTLFISALSLFAATALADDALHIGYRGTIWDSQGGNTCIWTDNHYDLGPSFTLSCWVREFQPKDPGGYNVILIQGAWGCEGVVLNGTYNTTTRNLLFQTVYRDGGNLVASTVRVDWTDGDMGIYDGGWHLLTAVLDAGEGTVGTGKLFVDGVAVATGDMHIVDYSADVEHDFCIGGYEQSNYPCGSYMADVGLWNRALSDSEVQGIFSHRINPADTGLVGYWPFASDLKDAVANGATPHDGRVFQGSWASSGFYGEGENYGNFKLRSYADWMENPDDGSASFTATLASREDGTNMTFAVSVQELGLGTTTFELLLGASATALTAVDGASVAYASDATVRHFSFPVVSVPWNETFYWAVRAVSVDVDDSYETVSGVSTFDTLDTAVYIWKSDVAEGDWENPANWSSDRTPCCGYPSSANSTAWLTSRTEPTVVRVSGTHDCRLGDGTVNGFSPSSRLTLVGDPARTDNRFTTTLVQGAGENQTVVFDNVSVNWWDMAPRFDGGRIVFAGSSVHVPAGGVTSLNSADLCLGFRIPSEGYLDVPFYSTCPLGNFLIGDSWTPTIPEGRFMRVSVEPDSPLLKVTGRQMRVKLAGGVVTEAAKAHIVCTAPQKGESSFEVLGDGIYFNYYNKPGFAVFIR